MHDPAYRIFLAIIVFFILDHFFLDGFFLDLTVGSILNAVRWIAGFFGG